MIKYTDSQGNDYPQQEKSSSPASQDPALRFSILALIFASARGLFP